VYLVKRLLDFFYLRVQGNVRMSVIIFLKDNESMKVPETYLHAI
jgi:hypothetical protein